MHKQTGTEQKLIRLGRLENVGLVGGKPSQLHESIEPDKVKWGQVLDQSGDPFSATHEVARGTELVVDEPPGEFG
jgi:hypothetical protein